jgi:hypothetical protein
MDSYALVLMAPHQVLPARPEQMATPLLVLVPVAQVAVASRPAMRNLPEAQGVLRLTGVLGPQPVAVVLPERPAAERVAMAPRRRPAVACLERVAVAVDLLQPEPAAPAETAVSMVPAVVAVALLSTDPIQARAAMARTASPLL